MSESIKAISERYFYLKFNFSDLVARCETDAQENEVSQNFTDASDCFDRAISLKFSDNAADIKQLREDLEKNTQDLKNQMVADEQIVTILGTLTAGSNLAKDLTGKGTN
ncbi:MAG: hypothetical protein QOE96_1114 [Blastocatellia bacterium]|jgi:mevalonate kinase|nr:hypothetical protein [Blastocatellia bacterium]